MYTILTPGQIKVGLGCLSSLKEIIAIYEKGKILLVTDEGIRHSGVFNKVMGATDLEPERIDIFDQIKSNPDIATMEFCGQMVASNDYKLIIGLGGGSPMDVAKASSILKSNGGKMGPLLGRGLVKKKGVPVCLIPTTSGTGSEVSQAIVVNDTEGQTKSGVWDPNVVSQYAIVDPVLTMGMPRQLTVDTGLDALVHGIEAYTARTTNRVARLYAQQCIALVVEHLPKAVQDGSDLEARSGMSLAATLGGLAFSNGGLGAAHALNLPLDTRKHIPHGRTVALMAPAVIDFNRVGHEITYTHIAQLLGENIDKLDPASASQRAVIGMKRFMESLGVSPYLKDHGIQFAEIESLAKEAFVVGQRLLSFNPRDINENDVMAIYRAAAAP